MASVWFNLGKTADLTTGQKTIIDTLHRMGKLQTFIAKDAAVHRELCPSISVESQVDGQNVAGEDAPAKKMTVGFSGLSEKTQESVRDPERVE